MISAGALVFALAGPLLAQAPDERARLDSLRASIQAVTDSGALIRRERERIAVARVERDDPFIHMELGYVSSRLGELTRAKQRYEDAASEFQWAGDLRPAWPYAWYNLGLAELATGEQDVILLENIRQLLGMDFLSRAAHAFARAVEADPAFSRALVDLASTALRQRIAPRLVVAQAALRLAATSAAGRRPEVLLVRGRVERRLGAHDSAVAAFRALVAVGDAQQAEVELARSLEAVGQGDTAVATYWRAAARPPTDSGRLELRRDLRWIATPAELAGFGGLARDSVYGWLRGFWNARDAAEGRRSGERLLEQFRRHRFVVDNFSLVSRHRAFDPSFAFADTTQVEFDDRGIIYLRHGEPDVRAQFQHSCSGAPATTGQNVPTSRRRRPSAARPPGRIEADACAAGMDVAVEANQSWLYRRQPPQPDLVFHFVARGDVQDWRLVESLADVLGAGVAVAVATSLDETAFGLLQQLYATRAAFGPVYELISRGETVGSNRLLAEERMTGQAMVREGTTTDSYALRFGSDLRPVLSTFAVADSVLRPELHVVFALPVTRLHALEAGGASAYALGLRLVVVDSAGRPLAGLDTVRVFRSAQPLGERAFLTARVSLGVPPGSWRWTFVVREAQADAGTAVKHQAVSVPRFDDGFSASDVIMGREGSGLLWRRPDGEVPLNPLGRFPRGGTATLFYELYGLPQGAVIETHVRVERRGGRSILQRLFGGGGGADLAYSTVTDAPGRARVRQQLGLEGLAAGRYTLVVELTDPASGRHVVRRSPFEIENRDAP